MKNSSNIYDYMQIGKRKISRENLKLEMLHQKLFQPILLTGVDFVLEIVRDVMQRFLIITKDDDSNNMKVFVLQNPMI